MSIVMNVEGLHAVLVSTLLLPREEHHINTLLCSTGLEILKTIVLNILEAI